MASSTTLQSSSSTTSKTTATGISRSMTRKMQRQLLTLLHTVGDDSATAKNEYDRPKPSVSPPSPPPSATNENLDFWNHIVSRRIKQLTRLDLEALKSIRDGIVRLLTTDGDTDDDGGTTAGSTTTTRQTITGTTTDLSKQQIPDPDGVVGNEDDNARIKKQYVSVVRQVLVCHFYNSVDTRIDRNERLESLQCMKEILNCLDMANARKNTSLME
eukprot:CAMPEP_0198264422 /NCGR_PEP_ID=MMETSP1447-20131203/15798_1 /TAXON_ID=420782 /ORGANISM="Chaetoceros dichaeta, Strain CCMP1751" /LENGTH=214 /DNA_ID=CAMNT_0043953359 /DNA_START=43 /DNA_END=687 /DNA_ORIENTATION=-